MTTPASALATGFADAIVARDLSAAAALLRPEIDFRAMTPNRIWEAGTPGEVEDTLRGWLADPAEPVERVEATPPTAVEDVTRVGWLVWISDASGPAVFEQQAYIRGRDGRIDWMRVICSGFRPRSGA